MIRKRRKFLFIILGFFAAIMFTGPNGARASDCYQLFYNWDCIEDLNFDKSEIILEWKTVLMSKHKDGSIKIGPNGQYFGAWSIWGTSFGIDSWGDFFVNNEGKFDDCNALFTGYKTMYGFMVCRNGANADKPPGCFLMMKLKPKDCPWITEH